MSKTYILFFFFKAETIFLNQDLEERNEIQEHSDEEDSEKLFWLEPCYKALVRHRKNKHVQVGPIVRTRIEEQALPSLLL